MLDALIAGERDTTSAAGRSTNRSILTSVTTVTGYAAPGVQQQPTSLLHVLKATVRYSGKDPAPH
jgi:hypothetical protein